MTYKFKAGDRVKHLNDEDDIGIVISCGEHMTPVQWEKDGEMDNCTENLYLVEDTNIITEQEAVMLLLSLGYTVSKSNA